MATILIVDDSSTNRQFLVTLLGYAGHRLLEAADGAEGLEQARLEHPALVIADIVMPTMDGFEFVRRLRATPEIGATPVIFYTAAYYEHEALANLQSEIEASGAHITREALPTVMGNERELIQLFQNLVGNALKFRSNQPPEIHVSVQRQPSAWIFSVRDNGIGIDPQFADRIFQMFQRLHRKDEYPGTGIGLAICKKVVEHHGGRIWLESAAGQGATFFFSLPAAAA